MSHSLRPLQLARLSFTVPLSLLKFSDAFYHLILCRPLLLSLSVFLSIRVFSSELALYIRRPKYWSFSPSDAYWELISFRIDLLSKELSRIFYSTTVGKHQFLLLSLLVVQLLYPYLTSGKTIALTRQTFVVMSLLFNTLFRFVIASLPSSKRLLILWLQSPPAVISEPKKIKSVTVSTFSPSICHEVMGPDAVIFIFWMFSFKPAFLTLFFHLHQETL